MRIVRDGSAGDLEIAVNGQQTLTMKLTMKGQTDGKLEQENWHTCNTTHCRGGWVVRLAGKAGYELERFHGTLLAAQLIYRESGSPINPCRFFDSNEEAMADMKRLAEQ